ncbi:MAG: glycosyltransferase [Armatimonadota bacterium]|nr:glycosyltransferase [Armatimonadota bacterium]MDR7526652.1 glycosyltransferase [Armatimonadota bacterium]MDR7586484.1 glycosyltransferase [Armatimonadota bacterium]
MTDHPLVSVVIPAHNEAWWINRSLESFLNQTYRKIEVIVVDDGSSDNTPDVASRYPVRVIRHDRCRGEAAARTAGTQAARGEIIVHGEADAVYPAEYVERGLAYFRDTEVMAVSCGEIRVHPEVRGLIADYARVRREATYRLRRRGVRPTYGCHLVRREVFERIGYYDPACTIGNDADFALRIEQAGLRVVWAPDLHFYHADPHTLRGFLRRVFRGNLTRRRFMERWGFWPRGWRMAVFLIWNTYMTMAPLLLAFGVLASPILVAAGGVGLLAESIGPILVHAESREAWFLALRRRQMALVAVFPLLLLLRARAAAYGRLGALLFSGRVSRMVTYD